MSPRKSRRKKPVCGFEKDAAPDIRALEQTLNDLAEVNRRLEHAASMLVTTNPEPESAPDPAGDAPTETRGDESDPRPEPPEPG